MLKIKLSSSKNLFSYGIRAFTSSQYSHVDVVLADGFYLGSQPGVGVVLHKEKCAVEHFYQIDVNYQTTIDFLFDQVGKPYDFSGIYGFLFHRNWEDDDKWFCSELVAAALNKSGNTFFKDSRFVSPGDIATLPGLKRVD